MFSFKSIEKYPYPTEFNVQDFVPKLLSTGINYVNWKTSMEDFIARRGLAGFIFGTAAAEGNNVQEDMDWKRSDDLVRAWILATLSEDIRLPLLGLKTANHLWTKLEGSYDRTLSAPILESAEEETPRRRTYHRFLHKAAIRGDWDEAKGIIDRYPDAVRSHNTHFSQTALSLAVSSTSKGRNRFVRKLLERMTPEDVWKEVDKSGKTALHHAAAVDNMEAARMLVKINRDQLPKAFDNYGETALHWAAFRGHRKMVLYLYELTKDLILHGNDYVGASLLCHLMQGELYDIALTLLQQKPKLSMECFKWKSLNPFDILVQKHSSFKSGSSLNFWERIHSGVPLKSKENGGGSEDVENPSPMPNCISVRKRLHHMIWKAGETFVPGVKGVREKKEKQYYALKLVQFICDDVAKSNQSIVKSIYKPALCNAVCVGIPEIVEEIILSYPLELVFENLDDLIKHAIMCRYEHVFHLIHQIDPAGRLIYEETNSFNNGLHLAARLGREQQIYLKARVAGPALQMQQELQWFKAVEKFCAPGDKEGRNSDGMTPGEVFSDTHQDLLQEGERWMKDTAASCTIVAALIATMVFAAAITIPGGNNSTSGYPLLSKQIAFIIFGIFDALALFSSITSVLSFLLILTSRYAEEDFLVTLPKRLITGLITLFFSILSTMVAFGAILYLVFGKNRTWILIPTGILAIFPAAFFGTLQFPLLVEMIRSTRGQGIFGKESDRMLI